EAQFCGLTCDDRLEFSAELRTGRASEILCTSVLSPGEDTLRVRETHPLQRLFEYRLRRRDRLLGGVIHGRLQLVGLTAHANQPQRALTLLQGRWQGNRNFRVV